MHGPKYASHATSRQPAIYHGYIGPPGRQPTQGDGWRQTLRSWRGLLMSHVDFKKCQRRMSLVSYNPPPPHVPCRIYEMPMSHVALFYCAYVAVTKDNVALSNFRIGYVALSILEVEGHKPGSRRFGMRVGDGRGGLRWERGAGEGSVCGIWSCMTRQKAGMACATFGNAPLWAQSCVLEQCTQDFAC